MKVKSVRLRWAALLLLAGAFVPVLTACAPGAGDPSGQSESSGPIVGVLIDQTCDATDAMRDWGRRAVETGVTTAAASSGTFMGEAVTTAEYQDGAADVLKQFSSEMRSSAAQSDDLEAQADEFLAGSDVEGLVTPEASDCGSDLLGAMAALSQSIGDEAKSGERSKDIVFVTNGIVIDDERGWNFVRDDMTPEYVKTVITEMRKEGTFPDLSGVSVQFVGLGEREKPLTAKKKAEIQAFWAEFASASGAGPIEDLGNVDQLRLPLEE